MIIIMMIARRVAPLPLQPPRKTAGGGPYAHERCQWWGVHTLLPVVGAGGEGREADGGEGGGLWLPDEPPPAHTGVQSLGTHPRARVPTATLPALNPPSRVVFFLVLFSSNL